MFNEEIKKRFIAERDKTVILPNNYLECQFNKVSYMEEELNKDVSNFTYYEIIEYYKLLNTSSADSLSVMNSQFSLYTQWCLQENLVKDNQNHFLEVTYENYKSCINKAIFDLSILKREVLDEWIEQLPNPKDKFVLLGLFEGLKGKDFCELAKLRLSDINGNRATLCTGRKVELSNKLISIIEECVEENTYYSISGKGVKTTTLIDNGYIIKDYPNVKSNVSDFQIGRKIYNSVTRILNYFGVLEYMSANSVYESGKIDMINRRSRELGITGNEYVYSDYIKEVEEKYNCNIVKNIYVLKYDGYLV